MEPAERSVLTPGIYIVTSAQRMPDGTLTATNINAERDGLKPGM
jgi:hypothetical protein